MAVMFFKDHLLVDMNSKPLSVMITMNLMTAVAILGSVGAGLISDKVFKGARSPVAMRLYFIEATVISCANARSQKLRHASRCCGRAYARTFYSTP